jgi:hypothetical protein
MGMGIYYLAVVHVKASSNLSGQFVVITNDTLRLFYASSSLIVTIMGMIVLLKRYYDSIYLWVFSTFSFAMIALSMTSAGFGAAILSQPDPGDLLEGVNWQLAIAFLVLHSLAFVLHVRHKTFYFLASHEKPNKPLTQLLLPYCRQSHL